MTSQSQRHPPTATQSPTTIQEPADDTFHTEQVMTVAGGHFIHDSYTAFLPPLLPLLQERLGSSYAGVGTLAVFLQLPSLLTPLIGYLADRVSLRYFVIFAPAITGTLMSIMGLFSNYLLLILLFMVAGVSMAAFHAPAPAMIGRIAGRRVGTGMSIFMASGELGRTVGPLVVVAGVTWWGLPGIWRLAGIGWLVSAFLYWRLRNISARPATQQQSNLRELAPELRRVFTILGGMMVPQMGMVVAITTYLPTFMRDALGANLWLAAASLTILEGAGVVGALLTGTLSDRFGRRVVLLVLLSTAPVLLMGFLYAPPWLAVPLLIGLGLTAISQTPVKLAIVQDHFPHNRAVANGIFMSMNFVIRALALWVVGLLADQIGLTNAFFWSGVAAFFSIPAVFWLPEKRAD
ncbi:MAG: MFS transporter [Caldilineaceae bacterium]|nr:MFS transporter [Caldilineaceae bacterium]